MTDCSRYLMCATPYRDCVIAVTETRNVTGRLGLDEVRALRVLADAGLVPSLVGPAAGPGDRSRITAAFPRAKAS